MNGGDGHKKPTYLLVESIESNFPLGLGEERLWSHFICVREVIDGFPWDFDITVSGFQ